MRKINKEELKRYILNADNIDIVFNMIHDINEYNNSLDFLNYEFNDDDFFQKHFKNEYMQIIKLICKSNNYKYSDDYVKIFKGIKRIYKIESYTQKDLYEEYVFYINEIIEAIEEVKDNTNIYIPYTVLEK